MIPLRRSFIVLALLLGAQAAEAKTVTYQGDFWDHVAMITTTWWVTTLIATALLGILIGFFVYRGAVSNGRAGGATGAGCLMAVIVFLLCQAVAVVVLAITLFNLPMKADISTKDTTKPAVGTGTDTTPTDTAGTTGSPKKPANPPTNNGDGF